jgi:hypothetical protein
MSAPEIITQTSENAQRLLERITKLASRRKRSLTQHGCPCAGYLVSLSADHDRFGGELGPLKLGETGTVIGNEGDDKLRFELFACLDSLHGPVSNLLTRAPSNEYSPSCKRIRRLHF